LDDFFSPKNPQKPKIGKNNMKTGKTKKGNKKMSNRKQETRNPKKPGKPSCVFSPFSGSTHLFFTIHEVQSCFSLSGNHSCASRESTIVIFTFRETNCG
jgi:hypothetical protein